MDSSSWKQTKSFDLLPQKKAGVELRRWQSLLFWLGTSPHCSAGRRWWLSTRKWEADVVLHPTVAQEESVVELRRWRSLLFWLSGIYNSWWLDSGTPYALPPFCQVRRANNRGRVQVVEQFIFHRFRRSKDNIINNKSTSKRNPTKRLDKVDSATGRIININLTLEINNITITKKDTTRIGHIEHKRLLFTNNKA